MRRSSLSLVVLLEACQPERSGELPGQVPPAACSVRADHVVSLSSTWVGETWGYGTDDMGAVRFAEALGSARGVRGGETVGFVVTYDQPVWVARADAYDGAITAGDWGLDPVDVVDVVSGGTMRFNEGVAQVRQRAGGVFDLGWWARIPDLRYGDDLRCFGFVVRMGPFSGRHEVRLDAVSISARVPLPHTWQNPFALGPLPTPHPTISFAGTSCGSSPMVVEVEHGSPRGPLALLSGTLGGTSTVPWGSCAGHPLPVGDPIFLASVMADDMGSARWTAPVSLPACLGIQAVVVVDIRSCQAGDPAAVP